MSRPAGLLSAVVLIACACVAWASARPAPQPPASEPASKPQTAPSTGPQSAPRDDPDGDPQDDPTDQHATRGQRVYVRVNRNTEVKGHVELEDNDVLVVRDLQGNLQTLAKPRIVQIVRLTDPKPGQTGIVRMVDGQIREGIIIEDSFDHVLIEIEGIRASLKRTAVDHVLLEPTIEERFAEYKKTLQPGDYDAHLTLCAWLFQEKRYAWAQEELLDLLEQVDMPEAKRLLNLVEAQLALQKPLPRAPETADSSGAEDGSAGDEPSDSGPVYPADLVPHTLISQADVNLMRVYEIDFDNPPRVTITPDTVRMLIENYGTSSLIPANQAGRTAMFRAAADNPLQIVRLMFELRARDLYGNIQVNSEPHSLNLFRRRVHDTWLINSCATNACHGGSMAGAFFLHRRDYKDDRVRYTNLLILDRLRLDPEWPLVNYERPEDSLIVQYALPREHARKPHPRVNGWKPAFSPTNARMREDAIDWIRAMMVPRPEYPVEYDPPRLRAPASPQGEPSERVPR